MVVIAPISLFYERKLHHCVRIFESITYVTGLKGLVRTVEYLYNTFPYFQVLLLTFDIDEPWSSSVVFILIIFTMCPKSLSAFLSWTISEIFYLTINSVKKDKAMSLLRFTHTQQCRFKITKSISAFRRTF